MRHSFFRIGIFFALLITMGVRQIWAYNPHFYLTGEKPTGGWSNDPTAWFLVSPASDSYDQYCTYVWLSENDYFGLNNGANRYSRCDNNDQDIKDGYGSGQFGYPDGNTQKDKAFKYIGATGLVRINVSEADDYCGETPHCREYYPWVWVNEGLEIGILKGEKVMFYFGSSTYKGAHDWLYLSTEYKTSHTASEQYHRLNEERCTSYISVAYVDAGKQYYISDYKEWGGMQMTENVIAGSLYSIYKDNNVDKIYRNVGSVPHFSTTTVNKTVGTVNSEIAATVTNSIYGNEQVLYYYYTTDGGTTFTKFDPSNISSLAVGVYTVYALGWDGHILVRSDNTVTLNIGVTISLDANGGTNGNVTSVFATSGIAASKVASLPTKTGYTFNGFWTLGGMEVINKNGEWKTNVPGYTDNSGKWICSAASTLYAHWTPKEYTIRLQGMEADSETDYIDVKVKYDGVLSKVTPHTKPNYTFAGYWTDDDDGDDYGAHLVTQLIDANGNWIPNVKGYTGNDGQGHPTWVHDWNISLYAQWTETLHDVTVAVSPAGMGSVTLNGSPISKVENIGYVTHSEEMTAVPANAAWVFKEWQVTSEAHLDDVHYSKFKPTMKITATADRQTLTAVFEKRYNLVGSKYELNKDKAEMATGGMPGWTFGSGAEFTIHNYTPNGDNATVNMSCTRNLKAGDFYYIFEIHDREKGVSLGRNNGSNIEDIYVLNDGGSVELQGGEHQDQSIFFYPRHEGQYTFRITYMWKDGDFYYPTVTVERPHQLHMGHVHAEIDNTSATNSGDTGGTLSATIGGSPISNDGWYGYGADITYTALPATGYTIKWYTDNIYSSEFSPQPPNSWTDNNVTHDENVYVRFTEIPTAVTLSNDGHGHVEIDGMTVSSTTVGVTTHRELTAVPDEGYKLNFWTIVSGKDIALSSTSTNPTTLSGRGAGAVSGQEVRANFTYRYSIKGTMNGENWETDHFVANIETTGGKVIGYVDIDLPANTSYEFAIYDLGIKNWYKSGTDKVYSMTNGNSYKWSFATDKAYNCGITTAGAGTYRFIWNITDKTMSVIYPNFVIYRTGDQGEDSESATHTITSPVESYAGSTISEAIEFRMKVRELDKWYTLCLPFEVNKVCVWDNTDGAYYDIVPYYRPTLGGTFYTGHYIIREPLTTNDFAIEGFEGRDRWIDPKSPTGYLPSANTPYIIQWHDRYFLGRYISFFGDTNQDIPSAFDAGYEPSKDDVVNIFGNNTMHNGNVVNAYLLDKDYGPSGAWLREAIGTNRTILPFECFIRANTATTTRYRILRRGMEETDTPTALEQISNHQSPMTIRVYTITGVLIGEYNDCSFQDAAHRIATDYNEGIYILRSENESMKLLLGGK